MQGSPEPNVMPGYNEFQLARDGHRCRFSVPHNEQYVRKGGVPQVLTSFDSSMINPLFFALSVATSREVLRHIFASKFGAIPNRKIRLTFFQLL